jgi:hypothetical protein
VFILCHFPLVFVKFYPLISFFHSLELNLCFISPFDLFLLQKSWFLSVFIPKLKGRKKCCFFSKTHIAVYESNPNIDNDLFYGSYSQFTTIRKENSLVSVGEEENNQSL